MAGRPTSLTTQVSRKIITALAEGVPRETAVAAAGIGRSTFYGWLDAARQPDADPAMVAFLDGVEKAEASALVLYVKIVKRAAPKSWQAAAWMLERRWPDTFGRKDRVSIEAFKRTEAERIARELGLDPDEVLAAADAILASG